MVLIRISRRIIAGKNKMMKESIPKWIDVPHSYDECMGASTGCINCKDSFFVLNRFVYL